MKFSWKNFWLSFAEGVAFMLMIIGAAAVCLLILEMRCAGWPAKNAATFGARNVNVILIAITKDLTSGRLAHKKKDILRTKINSSSNKLDVIHLILFQNQYWLFNKVMV